MNQSTETNELITALVKVQGQLTPAIFDKKGPYAKYATMNAIMDSCRSLLSENGLAINQAPTSRENGALMVGLTTRLSHISGQYIEDTFFVPLEASGRLSIAQEAGSIITYLRRYGLSAMLGIVSDEDTDGEPARNSQPAAQKQAKSESTPSSNSLPSATKAQLKKLHTIGTKYYGDEWDDKRPALVQAITDNRSRSSNDLTKAECSRLIEGITLKFETEEAE